MNIKDEAVEAAAEAIKNGRPFRHAETARAALTAALPHMGGVSVKMLEWDNYSAHTPFGAYTVSEDADDLWHFTFHCYPYGTESEEGWGRKEHAKAAAQADYERRVLSALASHEPAPDTLEPADDTLGANLGSTLEPAKEGPEVVGYWKGIFSKIGHEYILKDPHADRTHPLIRLSDYEALRAERDAALEAEDEAKDCFWAIYPDWAKAKGHGISTEAARTVLVKRAETSEARNVELVKALEPFANAKITYLDAPDGREVKAKHVHGLVYGDFRRARAALKGQSNEA